MRPAPRRAKCSRLLLPTAVLRASDRDVSRSVLRTSPASSRFARTSRPKALSSAVLEYEVRSSPGSLQRGTGPIVQSVRAVAGAVASTQFHPHPLLPGALMRTNLSTSLFVGAAIALVSATSARAQDPTQAGTAKAAATVEASVGTSIADRVLAGAAESFPKGTQKLYCFSKVTGAENSEVEHVWYKGDAEQGRVKLKVGGSPWRTYSSKTLGDDASGDWRCDVVQDGKVLQSVKFKVE